MAQIEDAKEKVNTVAKETETSVNSLVNTEDFDPGASAATTEQTATERQNKKENLERTGDAVREVYSPSQNPKIAQSDKTGKVVEEDGVG